MENTEPKKFDGDWAFFRLLNIAAIEKITSSKFMLSWLFKNPNMYEVTVKYILKAESTTNPFSNNFFSGFRLPQRLN